MNSDTTSSETTLPVAADSRRNFLKRAGLGAATLSASALLAGAGQAQAAAANLDIDILNFALNLEYLEAEFYLYAAYGAGLSSIPGFPLTGSGGAPGPVTVKANSQVPFTSYLVQQYAYEIATDEKNHVLALRSAITSLGGTPISRPPIDLLHSFNSLAVAAGLGNSFDPFASDLNFLLGAFVFEDVGVTAYKGASPLITNKGILEAAAGILSVESSHSAIVRTALFAMTATSMADIASIVQKISDLRDTLDGSGEKDQPLFDAAAGGSANLVVTDGNGIAFSRTTRQVLNIVYGAQNAPRGLFFPSGLRGTITNS